MESEKRLKAMSRQKSQKQRRVKQQQAPAAEAEAVEKDAEKKKKQNENNENDDKALTSAAVAMTATGASSAVAKSLTSSPAAAAAAPAAPPRRKAAAVDATFVKRMAFILRIVVPSITSKEAMLAGSFIHSFILSVIHSLLYSFTHSIKHSDGEFVWREEHECNCQGGVLEKKSVALRDAWRVVMTLVCRSPFSPSCSSRGRSSRSGLRAREATGYKP